MVIAFIYLFFKEKYVLWEKPHTTHVFIVYAKLVGYTCELNKESGHNSYPMTTYEISSKYT